MRKVKRKGSLVKSRIPKLAKLANKQMRRGSAGKSVASRGGVIGGGVIINPPYRPGGGNIGGDR